MTDAAIPQAGDASAAGTSTVPEMASPMSSDGTELILDNQSPGSTDPAPQESGTKDWEKEAKSWQGRYDKTLARFEGMEDVLEKHKIDGQQAATALDQYDLVLKDPTVGPLVNELLRTGKVDMPTSKTTEEIADERLERPWLKDLEERVGPMLEENRMLKAQLEGVQRNTGSQAVEKQVSRFLTEYPLTDEQTREFKEDVKKWMSNVNSPQGLAMLQNMTWEAFQAMGVPMIEKWRSEIEVRRTETKRQGLQAMATDAPSRVLTTGAEPTAHGPVARNKQQVIANAQAAAARARAE